MDILYLAMRKVHVISLFIVLLAATTLIPGCSRPTSTPFNWRAHVSTLAGDGSPAGLSDPFGIAIGRDGSIYVADAGEINAIHKLTTEGTLIRLAGGNDVFNTPSGLAIDSNGSLYVADTSNNRIRKITSTGVVSTVA